MCADDSVGELKQRKCQLTNVLPKRQKLLYLKIGSELADNSTLLSGLPIKSSPKMTTIGTVEDHIIVDEADAPEIVADFAIGDIKGKEVNNQKLRRRVDQYKIEFRNPCRKGKKLL